jgi:hypothetical protein
MSEAVYRFIREVTPNKSHVTASNHVSNARCINRVTDASSAPDKPSLLR